MKPPKIAIIGAGASGIAAASRLIESGLTNIKIFEAENRIGGRVHSVKIGNSYVDYGCQWVHGETGNTVYNLAKDLNVLAPSFNTYDNNTFYESSGKVIDQHIAGPLQDYFIDYVKNEKESPGSFGDNFMKAYKEKVLELFGNNSDDIKKAMLLLDWFHKLTLCYESAPNWYEVAENGNYQACEGNQLLHWKDKGYRLILDILMKKYPSNAKPIPVEQTILLNKEVSKICLKNSSEVVVSTLDGSTESFDHIIFTPSLGVLKERYKDLFEPSLPLYKQNAIEGLSFGLVNKILLKFPRRWWPKDCQGFSLLWTNDDRMNIVNEFNLGPILNGKSWLEDVFGFYVIDSHEDILLGWMVGECTQKFEEMSDEVITDGCMYLLKKFVGDKFDIPRPEKVHCTRWYSNKHFRGSYSFTSIKEHEHRTTNADLAKPILSKDGVPRILFAGEATHSSLFSTVHGAIDTGFREADRLINLYKLGSQTCKVAIVGAGMAGLGAAQTLIENGVKDILILEALERPGGRIKTVELNKSIIELGAQWLHSTSTALHRIAVKNGLIHEKTSDEALGIYIRDDGFIFDDLLVKKVDFQIGQILEECEDFVDALEYPSSVGDFVEQKFLEHLNKSEDSEQIKMLKLELFDWNMLFQIIDNACMDMRDISSKQWGRYLCLGKDGQSHINIKHGYGALVELLVEKLPCDILKLNTSISNLDYRDKKVKLLCQNDHVILADHVIVTSSIGYLKENLETLFTPPLPQNLSTCIKSFGFSGIGKIFLVFEERWWNVEGFQLIWSRRAQVCEEEVWTKFITGFDCVLEQPNVLLGWIGGEGVEVMEHLPEDTVGVHCVNLLRRFLLRGDIPYPTRVIKSNFLSCPWIRGGYSHATPECDRLGIGPSDLCEPVHVDGIPRILLAGEAAHPNYFSTTHGAFESGRDQAKKLIDYLQECGP